jgi:hypothetical protein
LIGANTGPPKTFKMYGLSVLLTSTLALSASATPFWSKLRTRGYYGSCLSDSDALTVATNFQTTIDQTFSVSFVKETFAKDFQDFSDSVNELINNGCPNGPAPLGSATFTSRKAFIQGQSGQPPIPFAILNVWHNCDTVTVRWRSSPGPGTVQPEEEVTGILVIETTPNPDTSSQYPFLIQTVFSEFNSGAWLYDLGVFTPSC